MTQPEIYSFIGTHKLAVLSTLSTARRSQSALIGIAVTPELEIVFDTVKSSRKYPNLISNPACSLVIGWSGEKTLQYEGMATELTGDELARYLPLYFRAWPECVVHQSWPGIAYFVIRPTWIRYSDFDQNPPLIREFNF